jgi:hypothetical protein
MQEAKWKMMRLRKVFDINQLRVMIPGSSCLGGGGWHTCGKSRQDKGLRNNV